MSYNRQKGERERERDRVKEGYNIRKIHIIQVRLATEDATRQTHFWKQMEQGAMEQQGIEHPEVLDRKIHLQVEEMKTRLVEETKTRSQVETKRRLRVEETKKRRLTEKLVNNFKPKDRDEKSLRMFVESQGFVVWGDPTVTKRVKLIKGSVGRSGSSDTPMESSGATSSDTLYDKVEEEEEETKRKRELCEKVEVQLCYYFSSYMLD